MIATEDAAGRATLALEVVKGVRKQLGSSFLIQFRLDAVELADGGKSIEEGIEQARLLEAAGVDVIHSSLIAQMFWRESRDGQRFLQSTSALPKEQPKGNAVQYAAKIKAAVDPVIAVNCGRRCGVQSSARRCCGPSGDRPADDSRPRNSPENPFGRGRDHPVPGVQRLLRLYQEG